ncbi:Uncharacterised protein [Proteus mirabilis]|uniref:Uncharacterized protein n=1 Tax=Proteus mirabilis TaxID=584 RepID=A0A2X2BED3_PROMI|nr:Uncharacterised protein [Proteus mirabilis]
MKTILICVWFSLLNLLAQTVGLMWPICSQIALMMVSTATSAVILQVVPVKYQLLGSLNQIKGYMEDATNATAGVFVTRPWAVTRLTGI